MTDTTPTHLDQTATVDALRANLAEYKQIVRDRAIRGFADDRIASLDGLNESLDRLGLQGFTPKYECFTNTEWIVQLKFSGEDRDEANRLFALLHSQEVHEEIDTAITAVLAERMGPAVTATIPRIRYFPFPNRRMVD